jgi:ceramide glucosyltransferase
MDFLPVATVATAVLLFCSLVYTAFAIERVANFRRRLKRKQSGYFSPPVTLLKPMCGLEVGLAENLRSFCRQNYDDFQIVFGVRDRKDPAIAVINAIREEFPERDIELVIDDRVLGSNYKISNLIHMFHAAKHDFLIVSDSDMRVDPDYIRTVVAPFEREEVGATTCLYSGSVHGGLASRLGAVFINDWFLPSALIPMAFGEIAFCFGATMAIRRRALEKIGGFDSLVDIIADDYMLGQRTVEQGYKIAVVPYVVDNVVFERGLKSLFLHELRWGRTIRSVQPAGYALSFITDMFAVSLILAVMTFFATSSLPLALAPVVASLALRYALHHMVSVTIAPQGHYSPWLLPLRDLLSFAVRICVYYGNKVHWRQQVLVVKPHGVSRKFVHPLRDHAVRHEKHPVSQPTDF